MQRTGFNNAIVQLCREYKNSRERLSLVYDVILFSPHHAPPQGIGVAGEARLALFIHSVLFRQVDKVGGKYQAQESDVQGGDQLLKQTQEVGCMKEGST